MKILFQRYPTQLVRVLILALHNFETTIFSVWALAYGKARGIPEAHMLGQTVVVQFSALFAIPFWTWLADKIGRKKVYIGGYFVVAVLLFFYMNALQTASIVGVYALGFVMQGLFYSAVNGVWPSFYGEQFPTKVRLSGTALATQIVRTLIQGELGGTIDWHTIVGSGTEVTIDIPLRYIDRAQAS